MRGAIRSIPFSGQVASTSEFFLEDPNLLGQVMAQVKTFAFISSFSSHSTDSYENSGTEM